MRWQKPDTPSFLFRHYRSVMTTAPRPRFSVRAGLTEAPEHDGSFENVPEHLLLPLQEWVAYALDNEALVDDYDEDGAERTICLRLRIPTVDEPHRGGSKCHRALITAVGPRLLDVIDAVLAYLAEHGVHDQASIRPLTDTLNEAGSAYRVTEAGDGLEERVTPAVRNAVRQTVADRTATETCCSTREPSSTTPPILSPVPDAVLKHRGNR